MDSPNEPKTQAVPKALVATLVAIMVVLAALCTYLACANVTRSPFASKAVESPSAIEERKPATARIVEYHAGTFSENGVKTPYTYSTVMGAVTLVTYPSFSFSYPEAWSVERETVERGLEEVTLQRNGTDITVNYSYGLDGPNEANVHRVSIKKVADSDFWPDYVQGTSHIDLGPFMVAEVVLSKTTADGAPYEFTYYAVLPESALRLPDTPGMDIASGVPSFRYSGRIAFWSLVPESGITDDQRNELIAILSSFTNGTTEEEYWKCVEASATFEE